MILRFSKYIKKDLFRSKISSLSLQLRNQIVLNQVLLLILNHFFSKNFLFSAGFVYFDAKVVLEDRPR